MRAEIKIVEIDQHFPRIETDGGEMEGPPIYTATVQLTPDFFKEIEIGEFAYSQIIKLGNGDLFG
jgi:hypothetical protein